MPESKDKSPLAGADGSAWVGSEWWVFRGSLLDETDPWVRWGGPFESQESASDWIEQQKGWPGGLRAGRAAIVWIESTNTALCDGGTQGQKCNSNEPRRS